MGEARHLQVDQARLLPHLRDRAQLEYDQRRVFAREYQRAAAAGVDTTLPPATKVPNGDDRHRLRGLPCIAREVTGAQPGTDPVCELLRKEARQQRRR